MNRTIQTVVIAVGVGGAVAGPLERKAVPADAKWVLHLDMEALRASTVGKFLTDKVIQPKYEKGLANKNLQLTLSPQNISAITAYGANLQGQDRDGVLLIKTTADLKKDIEAVKKLAESEGKSVTVTQQEPFLMYNLNDDAYLAPDVNGWLMLSKRKANVEQARAALVGEKQTLAQTETFKDYSETPGGFFFVGMAEGFQNETVPAQAQVLKETTGGRVAIGENADKVFVNLVLKGKSAESAQKIQQVAQGLIALVQLSGENPELAELVRNVQVTSESQKVTLNLNVPVSKAINEISEREGIEGEPVKVNKR